MALLYSFIYIYAWVNILWVSKYDWYIFYLLKYKPSGFSLNWKCSIFRLYFHIKVCAFSSKKKRWRFSATIYTYKTCVAEIEYVILIILILSFSFEGLLTWYHCGKSGRIYINILKCLYFIRWKGRRDTQTKARTIAILSTLESFSFPFFNTFDFRVYIYIFCLCFALKVEPLKMV